jgi:predicted ATP-dependent endonuclease of OLD family
MKIDLICIHSFRSIKNIEIKLQDLTLLVGANNSGKSNAIDAIRTFYKDRKVQATDFPKNYSDEESWVELSWLLNSNEVETIIKESKLQIKDKVLTIRRYFEPQEYLNKKQSNYVQIIGGEPNKTEITDIQKLIPSQIIYIPSLIKPSENFKTSAASPFRDLLNKLIKNSTTKQKDFEKLNNAFMDFLTKEKKKGGFIDKIQAPINEAIKEEWGIKMDIVANPIKPEKIVKEFIRCTFNDILSNDHSTREEEESALELENHGGGFQRYVIYELLKIIPNILAGSDSKNSNLNPSFNLILFEEPETFLHPTQQENMTYKLLDLASQENYQIIATTHSAIFASKAIENEKDSNENFKKIVRFEKKKSESDTKIFQTNNVVNDNEKLLQYLQNIIDKGGDGAEEATKLMKNASEEVKNFRLPLWLNHERSILFFSNAVLLVEGPTEKILFNYLLKNKWHDLNISHINIIDVLGKYNFHHFMDLMKDFGIDHGILFDDDIRNTNQKNPHPVINQFIEECKNDYTLAKPVAIQGNIEKFLGLDTKPPRSELKPLYMLKALVYNEIKLEQLEELRGKFCEALNIDNK